MSVRHAQIDADSEAFRRNREADDRQRAEIAATRAVAGGASDLRNRHTTRGKRLGRERASARLDPRTPFLEPVQLGGENIDGNTRAGCACIAPWQRLPPGSRHDSHRQISNGSDADRRWLDLT
jgi:3-methylcrotonyl-CoA carboxylase beta subunit